jgi:hypothetical protein
MTTQISKMTSREAFDKAMEQQGEPVAWLHRGCATTEHGYTSDERARAVGYKPLYTSAPTIPEGYVLVPLYPSNNMMESARLATESEGIVTSTWLRRAVWDAMIVAAIKEAMIAAAPKPKEPE